MGFFGAAHGWGEGVQKGPLLPKICHKYPAMMKLGTVVRCLKKSQKNINHTPCVVLTSAFFIGNQQISLYQKIQI